MRPGPTGRRRRRMAGVALLTTLTTLALQGAALAARLFQHNYLSVAHRGGRGSSAR